MTPGKRPEDRTPTAKVPPISGKKSTSESQAGASTQKTCKACGAPMVWKGTWVCTGSCS
jgi:hypothetical protein